MNFNIVSKSDEIIMALVHYFVTVENYTPIVVKGVKDEIWLENLEAPYRIIRINSNHIHNEEQYKFDMFKTEKVMEQIKKKTLSMNMNTLNILLDVSEDLEFKTEAKNISSIKINDVEELTTDKDLLDLFPKMESKLLKDKAGLDLILNVTNDINAKTVKDNETFSKIFEPKRIIITPLLIIACIIIFISMYIIGAGSEDANTLIMFGANVKYLVLKGEVWRLFTSMFLHVGILHLIVNMYALNVIGRELEGIMGKLKFTLIYLGSGIIGSLFSVVLNNSISAGASGAIFGLMGSLLYFGYHYRLYLGSVLKTQIIPVIVLNLLIGFLSTGIDNFAHIGGLIGGYLLTMALGIPGKFNKKDQINGSIVLVLLIIFMSYMLLRG